MFYKWMPRIISFFITMWIAFLVLFPFHSPHTKHIVFPQIRNADNTFEVALPSGADVKTGDRLPVYRFGGGTFSELGRIDVLSVNGSKAVCKIKHEDMQYRVPTQGKIIAQKYPLMTVDFGTNHVLKLSNQLYVFKDNEYVGDIMMLEPGNPYSAVALTGYVPKKAPANQNYTGLWVSEYKVLTLIAVTTDKMLLSMIELGVFLLFALIEILLQWKTKYGLLPNVGRVFVGIYSKFTEPLKKFCRMVAIIAAGIPVSYFFAAFVIVILNALIGLLPFLKSIPIFSSDYFIYILWAMFGVFYLFIFIWKKQFPLLWIWNIGMYKPRKYLSKVAKNENDIKTANWLLATIVTLAFSFTLFGFIAGNMSIMVETLAPQHAPVTLPDIDISKPDTLFPRVTYFWDNVGAIFTKGPRAVTVEHIFYALRMLIFTLCIIGCLIGYLNTIFMGFRKTKVRNVDFTPLGWFVNGMCYGPIFGWVVWSIVPGAEGKLPMLTDGLLFYSMLIFELVFNILYTASIVQMGKKFGVMVDKGMIENGYFGLIRHPNYTLESFLFFFYSVKGLYGWENLIGLFFPYLMYYVRSERDEAFMRKSNPDYAAYAEKTKYKYIDGLI